MRFQAFVAALLVLAAAEAARPQAFFAQAVYERAAPAVAVVRTVEDRRRGLGTAFGVAREGWLVTAAHVVRRAERISVEFEPSRQIPARLGGYDARRDLAVLRVVGTLSDVLQFADPSALRVGEPVAVIGNPGGRPKVLTTGVLVSIGVTLPGLTPGIFIRVSAEVAPGSSGGPVLNAQGEVLGVVVAAVTQPGAEGGLAVAAPAVVQALPALMAGARVERAWLGILGVTVTSELARQRGLLVSRGVLVLEVVPDGPAHRAGLRGDAENGTPGDVIVSVNGTAVETMEDLLSLLAEREPGERVRLRVARGRTLIDLDVVLGVRP